MKGADQCPRCASRKWINLSAEGLPPPGGFYSADVRACRNCSTIWEPFDPAELLDPTLEPLGAFKHPCGNCAFRKGSPEQRDPQAFAHLRAQLGWAGASFHCHKGVPVDPQDPDGFAYPKDAEGVPIKRKLRLCRGYLNQLGSFPMDRQLLDAADDEPWTEPAEQALAPYDAQERGTRTMAETMQAMPQLGGTGPLLRRREVEREVGLSRSSIYDYMARGAFPATGEHRTAHVRWLATEIEAWKASKAGSSGSTK